MSGWRIARIGGVDVRVDPSFLLIALLITSSLWSTFSDPFRYPRLGSGEILGLALLSAFLFFLSILGHELAHAVMSRALGIPVLGIMLYMFGGATYMKTDGQRPMDEFFTTLVGPLTSAAIGGLFLIIPAVMNLSSTLTLVLQYLGRLNLFLAVYNMLPSFPLDGGRLLRSVIWRVTGDSAKATVAAARTGQVASGAMIAFAAYRLFVDQDFGWLWFGAIALMLFSFAGRAVADARRQRVLQSATAAQVMSPPPPAVPADLLLRDALSTYLDGHEGEAFPVTRAGEVVGFVSLNTARGVATDRPVIEATIPPGAVAVAGTADTMDTIVSRLGQNDVAAVLVMDRGELVGIIEPDDVNRFLRGVR